MTVGELKAILAGVRDDMEVLSYDQGYPSTDVSAEVLRFAPLPGEAGLSWVWEHSGHPEGTDGVEYFAICG